MTLWLISALIFVSVGLLVGGLLYSAAAGEGRVGRRLQGINRGSERPEAQQEERPDPLPTLTSLLERSGRHSAIERQLERGGLNWRPSEFVAAGLMLSAVLALVGWFVYGPLGAAAGIVIVVGSLVGLLKALEAQRLRKFEHQLPDALMLVASSLRSGYGLLRAIQAVRDEMEAPVSIEFGKTLDEANVGVAVGDALRRLAQRVPLPDLEIATTAMLVQLDMGGNLAEVMDTVAATVRERRAVRAEMMTLTAEGRLSGVVLFLLPMAMAVILVTLNPAYMSVLFRTTVGHLLILFAAILQIMGGVVINRMLQLDF